MRQLTTLVVFAVAFRPDRTCGVPAQLPPGRKLDRTLIYTRGPRKILRLLSQRN